MKHEDRRKEVGKMMMDVTKYLLTVGVFGSLLSERISFKHAIVIFIIALITFIIGLCIIPSKKEGK
ncbi:MAG: DUF6722 family protein [bacterium]